MRPRRAILAAACEAGVSAGELAPDTDVEAVVSMLIGSFYGIYIAHGRIPEGWPGRALSQVWPAG